MEIHDILLVNCDSSQYIVCREFWLKPKKWRSSTLGRMWIVKIWNRWFWRWRIWTKEDADCENGSESDVGSQRNLFPQEVSKHLINDISRVVSINKNIEKLCTSVNVTDCRGNCPSVNSTYYVTDCTNSCVPIGDKSTYDVCGICGGNGKSFGLLRRRERNCEVRRLRCLPSKRLQLWVYLPDHVFSRHPQYWKCRYQYFWCRLQPTQLDSLFKKLIHLLAYSSLQWSPSSININPPAYSISPGGKLKAYIGLYRPIFNKWNIRNITIVNAVASVTSKPYRQHIGTFCSLSLSITGISAIATSPYCLFNATNCVTATPLNANGSTYTCSLPVLSTTQNLTWGVVLQQPLLNGHSTEVSNAIRTAFPYIEHP